MKFAITGSRNGLFMPRDLPPSVERLFVAEGESDAAALLDLGVDAIGRAGCDQSVQFTVALSRRLDAKEIVVVADSDPPGQRGAIALARRLAVMFRIVRVLTPPTGIKDAREWKRDGLTRDQLDLVVAQSTPLTVNVRHASQEIRHVGC
jgi:DNA primase